MIAYRPIRCRWSLADAVVDLVELDPPFNSNRDDNVIFRGESA